MNKHQNKNSAMELLNFIDSLGLQESKKIQLLKKMDNSPEIMFDGKKFSELSTKQKLSVLNYYAGVMSFFGLLTRGEREKVYQRFVKEFHKSE